MLRSLKEHALKILDQAERKFYERAKEDVAAYIVLLLIIHINSILLPYLPLPLDSSTTTMLINFVTQFGYSALVFSEFMRFVFFVIKNLLRDIRG